MRLGDRVILSSTGTIESTSNDTNDAPVFCVRWDDTAGSSWHTAEELAVLDETAALRARAAELEAALHELHDIDAARISALETAARGVLVNGPFSCDGLCGQGDCPYLALLDALEAKPAPPSVCGAPVRCGGCNACKKAEGRL